MLYYYVFDLVYSVVAITLLVSTIKSHTFAVYSLVCAILPVVSVILCLIAPAAIDVIGNRYGVVESKAVYSCFVDCVKISLIFYAFMIAVKSKMPRFVVSVLALMAGLQFLVALLTVTSVYDSYLGLTVTNTYFQDKYPYMQGALMLALWGFWAWDWAKNGSNYSDDGYLDRDNFNRRVRVPRVQASGDGQ